jgi:four helix bundle suffix protein
MGGGGRVGYEKLVVYWLAMTIQDLNQIFCDRYDDKKSRTYDQKIQASRSGKQNVVEGSQEKSLKSNIFLTGVAKSSYCELLEDYKDYLRQHNLPLWDKNDPRVLEIRRTRDLPELTYKYYRTYMTYTSDAERFANLMITLIYKETYLLDQLLRSLEHKFVTEGGFTENLFKKRLKFRRRLNGARAVSRPGVD